MDFQRFDDIATIEIDTTGWVKATRTTGEVFLLQPRDALALMTWSQAHAQILVASQQAIDQTAARSAASERRPARPMHLVETPSRAEPHMLSPTPRKRRRRQPLPFPSIQISQALPCQAGCQRKTMTALLDFGHSLHAPGHSILCVRSTSGPCRQSARRLVSPFP